MSHKRPSKRGINAIDYTNSDYSPTSKSVPQKRPRIEQYSEFQVQTKSSDETPSVRRRSSRAPKPKVFDDEYMDTSVRSPGSDREVQKKKDPKASVSRNQGERRSIDDGLVVIDDQDTTTRRSSRVPKPKIFDEDYVEPTKIKGSNDKNEKIMAYATDPKILQDEQKDVSQKSKIQNKDKVKSKISSKNINQQDVNIVVGPKKTVAGAQKPKKTNSNSKHVKASPIAELELPPQRPLKSNEELDAKGSPKVRTSSRTPVPKKTFALIDDSPISKPAESIQGEEDLYMGVLSQGPHGSKPSKKISLTQSDSSLTSGEEIDIIYTSPFIGKKKGNSKPQEAGSDGEKKKKISKKSKAGSDSLDVSKDIMARETTKHLEGKKSGNVMGNITKDKSKKGSSKDIDSKIDVNKGDVKRKKKDAIESIVDVEEMPKEVKKKSKKKKVEVKVALQQNISNAANSTPGSHEDKHSFSEHGKKSSKHSKTKHKDEPHSEVKDEDHHIILKVHLPHAEGSHHSHSSHKKHKHKHSSESRSGTESDSKAKKRKLSLESDSSSEDKHKKKLSIKFKGLSSSTPGVEFEGAKEPVGIEKGKKNKDLGSEGTNKKASKKAADDKPSVASSSDEKEHVKVVIKKTKQDIKVLTDDSEKSVKKGANKGGKEKAKEDKEQKTEASTSSKTTPKKKSKVGESPKSAEKEKRKIVSGYLLFCKKERSRINEANPGLEFAQISQKVGEAWKNLPESTRQEWKAKANDVKRTLLVQQEQKKTETTCTKSGTDAVDMAAHLKLLGESLSVIGASLMAQRETEVHGSLSVLLDSILCAICPLTFLTSHIPGIPGIAKDKQLQILDDLAYTMPGLG